MHLSVHRRTSETDERTVAVLVLGMHRSGTSSVAGTLVRLGGTAPQNLMPPSESNERGHWESTVLADLNDEILAAGGSDWQDWRPYDVARIDPASANDLHARAKSALASEFGDTGLPIVKDPRMCRLMRFWAPVFEEAKWSVRALLPLRSPLEVVWSLKRRNEIGPANGCLMWLRHVLDAEAETRGMARAFFVWRDFLADKSGTLARVGRQLDLKWPNQNESVYADIDDFVSADLRHQKASEAEMHAHPAINELVKEAYSAVIKLAEDPSNDDVQRKLDEVRARFESAAANLDRPMGKLEAAIVRTRSRAIAKRDQFPAIWPPNAKLRPAPRRARPNCRRSGRRTQNSGQACRRARPNCRPFGRRAKGVCSAASRRQRRTSFSVRASRRIESRHCARGKIHRAYC